MPGRRYVVTGRVQGVSYRAAACRAARALGLTGWVRNLPDGSVEAFACGPEDALSSFAGWLREGPPLARVSAVSATDCTAPPPAGFEIR